MMRFIRNLVKPSVNYQDLIKAGALVIDVRTPNEYQTGHVNRSINIPLDNFENGLSGLKTEQCIIVCCASGMRSAHAKNILISNGFKEVYNAGSWRSLNHKIN